MKHMIRRRNLEVCILASTWKFRPCTNVLGVPIEHEAHDEVELGLVPMFEGSRQRLIWSTRRMHEPHDDMEIELDPMFLCSRQSKRGGGKLSCTHVRLAQKKREGKLSCIHVRASLNLVLQEFFGTNGRVNTNLEIRHNDVIM